MSWIKCSERMPAEGQYVLFFVPASTPGGADHYIATGSWGRVNEHIPCAWSDGDQPWSAAEVTHWQPLPEPPND